MGPISHQLESPSQLSNEKPTPPSKPKQGLKIGCLNVRSLYRKIDEVHHIILSKNFHIFGINETWLDSFITDDELSLEGYDLIRCDRNRHGGGVCLFIKQSISYNVLHDVNNCVESVWIKVTVNSQNFGIGCAYRPPSADNTYYNAMLDQIEQVKCATAGMILMGDLNFNYTVNEKPTCPVRYIEAAYELTQLVNKPTRITESSSSLLDVILTSVPENHEVTDVLSVALSDHYLVWTVLKTCFRSANGTHNTVTYRDFSNFNDQNFINELATSPVINKTITVDAFVSDWNVFKSTFNSISNKHAPMVTRRHKQRFNPWITNDIVKLMYQRDHTKKKLDKLKTTEIATEYRKLRNKVTQMIRLAKRTYFDTELSKVATNPKETWKLIDKITGGHSKQRPPKEISAQDFNDYFSNIGAETVKHLPPATDPPWKGPVSRNVFKLQPISSLSVVKHLKKLGHKTSSDVLGMDNKLLYISADIIAPLLTQFFNMSILTGTIPKDWKFARVTPVFKGKGDKLNKNNYRPISVISHIAKIFEREIQSQFMKYLVENDFISIDQSAYRQYHGTHTSLQRVVDDWLDVICDEMYVGVCLLDISKCFDTINHQILCKKLKNYGILNNEYDFFKSYLSERSQIVSCNNDTSSISEVCLGVPQGSVLGPILFLLYVNDVNQHIHLGTANIYADDTLIYYAGNSLKDVEMVLQKCLDDVSQWYDGNRLVVNPSKCVSLLITAKHKQSEDNNLTVTMNNNAITQVNTTNYLGVNINECLSWDNHIEKLCSQLSFKISRLARIRSFTPSHVLRKMYFACIQTTIDYAINVWGNTSLININKVQRLQNFAARILSNNFDYVNHRGIDILKDLCIMNVKQRAVYFNLILMFKCIHGLAPEYLSSQIIMACEVADRSTRFNNYNNVYVPFPRKDIFKSSFIYNSSHLWNEMPNDLKEITCLHAFKLSLKKYIFTCF